MNIENYIRPGAIVSVDVVTTSHLLEAIRELNKTNKKLVKVLQNALSDYEQALYPEDLQFDWTDEAKAAIAKAKGELE